MDYVALKDSLLIKSAFYATKLYQINKFVDQVLADANISSQTNKLNSKIDLLQKQVLKCFQ